MGVVMLRLLCELHGLSCRRISSNEREADPRKEGAVAVRWCVKLLLLLLLLLRDAGQLLLLPFREEGLLLIPLPLPLLFVGLFVEAGRAVGACRAAGLRVCVGRGFGM